MTVVALSLPSCNYNIVSVRGHDWIPRLSGQLGGPCECREFNPKAALACACPNGHRSSRRRGHPRLLTVRKWLFLGRSVYRHEDRPVPTPHGGGNPVRIHCNHSAVHRTGFELPCAGAQLDRFRKRLASIARCCQVHIAITIERVAKQHANLALAIDRYRWMAAFTNAPLG